METTRNRFGLVKILLFFQIVGLAVVMWLAVEGTGCALAAPCPTGSSIIFDQTVGIQGGTIFTNTFTSTPTAARLTTFQDASGTVPLLNTAQSWSAVQTMTAGGHTFNDNIPISLGTSGGEGTLSAAAGVVTLDMPNGTLFRVDRNNAGNVVEVSLAGSLQGYMRVGATEFEIGTANNVPLRLSPDDGSGDTRLIIENSELEIDEVDAPGAGAADTVRIYAIEGGGALTDLAAVFQDGTVDIFAQETTEPTDAVVAAPDETVGTLVVVRPHPGTVQLVARIPGFGDWVISEKEFHAEEKIGWVQGAEKPLPVDWYVESTVDQAARLACEGVWDMESKTCVATIAGVAQ